MLASTSRWSISNASHTEPVSSGRSAEVPEDKKMDPAAGKKLVDSLAAVCITMNGGHSHSTSDVDTSAIDQVYLDEMDKELRQHRDIISYLADEDTQGVAEWLDHHKLLEQQGLDNLSEFRATSSAFFVGQTESQADVVGADAEQVLAYWKKAKRALRKGWMR